MENIPVLYINLNSRRDRLKILERDVLPYFKHKHRIEAVHTPHNGYEGCVLSHIKALEYAKSQDWDEVIIMEDDFEWVNRDKFVYPDIFFDVCMISGKIKEKKSLTANYDKVLDGRHTDCYLVKNHFYNTLICNFKEGYEKLKIDFIHKHYIDVYWLKLQKSHTFISPSLCIGRQREDFSDIQKRIMKRF